MYARAVLIDSGAFIALANPVDEHYEAATACLEEIVRRRLPVVVPMPVVFESYRRILHVVGRPAALTFLDGMMGAPGNIERCGEDDEADARALIARYADRMLTLTDAASMAIATRMQIASVFSFDEDFLIAGFNRVPPLQ